MYMYKCALHVHVLVQNGITFPYHLVVTNWSKNSLCVEVALYLHVTHAHSWVYTLLTVIVV